jgi:hypothetical protein
MHYSIIGPSALPWAFAGAALFSLMGVSSCTSREAGSSTDDSVGVARSAIEGGTDDTTDTHVVVLYNQTINEDCTGTLIASNLVLTAAHCVADKPLVSGLSCSDFIYSGTAPAATLLVSQAAVEPSHTNQYVLVTEIIPLPAVGDSECDRDLALLVLTNDVDPTQTQFAEPRLDTSVSLGESFSAIGYGETTSGVGDGVRRRLDDLTVGCTAQCNKPTIGKIEWIGHPAVAHTGGRPGDSGSPAFDADGRVIGVFVRHHEYPAQSTQLDDLMYSAIAPNASWLVGGATHAAELGQYQLPHWAGGSGGAGGGNAGGAGGEGSAVTSSTGSETTHPATASSSCAVGHTTAPPRWFFLVVVTASIAVLRRWGRPRRAHDVGNILRTSSRSAVRASPSASMKSPS